MNKKEASIKGVRNWKPFFIENSKVPTLLSYISPINIWAISLVFFVFCRGTLNEKTRIHETIHYQQWVELLFVGFAILYPAFWVANLIKGMSPSEAYFSIPFEIEAYSNEHDPDYLKKRKRYSWARRKTS